jgi:hypothetical protein
VLLLLLLIVLVDDDDNRKEERNKEKLHFGIELTHCFDNPLLKNYVICCSNSLPF